MRRSQQTAVLSSEPETMCRPSGDTATQRTPFSCPARVLENPRSIGLSFLWSSAAASAAGDSVAEEAAAVSESLVTGLTRPAMAGRGGWRLGWAVSWGGAGTANRRNATAFSFFRSFASLLAIELVRCIGSTQGSSTATLARLSAAVGSEGAIVLHRWRLPVRSLRLAGTSGGWLAGGVTGACYEGKSGSLKRSVAAWADPND